MAKITRTVRITEDIRELVIETLDTNEALVSIHTAVGQTRIYGLRLDPADGPLIEDVTEPS